MNKEKNVSATLSCSRNAAEIFEYTEDMIMSKEHLCSYAVIFPSDDMQTLISAAPSDQAPFSSLLEGGTAQEISEFLRSYDNRIMLCELQGSAALVVPSIYPSSSLALALVFDSERIGLCEILRLLKREEYGKDFIVSKKINGDPARMSDALRQRSEIFYSFCDELRECFGDLIGLRRAMDIQILCDRALRISRLVGCPVTFERSKEDIGNVARTDLSLFCAFLLTFLLSARFRAPDRRASFSVEASSEAAMLTVRFESSEPMSISNEILVWERLAADRNMHFEYLCDGKDFSVSFHPLRRDWSYLGIKQDFGIR